MEEKGIRIKKGREQPQKVSSMRAYEDNSK